MAHKKTRNTAKGRGGKAVSSGKTANATLKQLDPAVEHMLQLSPQERVNAVKPLWTCLTSEARHQLLTVDIGTIRETARQVAQAAKQQAVLSEECGWGVDPYTVEQMNIEAILEEALNRLRQRGTWKVWKWHGDEHEFYDAETFRKHFLANYLQPELAALLPKTDLKEVETKAEEGLRSRMGRLLERITEKHQQLRDESVRASLRGRQLRANRQTSEQLYRGMKDFELQTITMIMETLEMEHEYLSKMVKVPIVSFIHEALPDVCRSSWGSELHFGDLDKLLPEQVARVCEWLTEKVDALCAQLKPDSQHKEGDHEQEDMGDIDLWCVSEDGQKLVVNNKWLSHLQQRLLGEDGHPRKSKRGEDGHGVGLVLEWVYGCIVSTAEKARDAAQRCLSFEPPSTQQSYNILLSALQQQYQWQCLRGEAQALLAEVHSSRQALVQVCEMHQVDSQQLRPKPPIRPEVSQTSSATAAVAASANSLSVEAGHSESSVSEEACPLKAQATSPACMPPHTLPTLAAAHQQQPSKPASGLSRIQVNLPEPAGSQHPQLPDEVILYALQHELVLTQARISVLWYDRLMAEKAVSGLNSQLRLHEPELARLRKQVEEHGRNITGSGGPGTVENLLKIAAARLQGIYKKKRAAELELARKTAELQQYQTWRTTTDAILHKFRELLQLDVHDLSTTSPTLVVSSTTSAATAAALVSVSHSQDGDDADSSHSASMSMDSDASSKLSSGYHAGTPDSGISPADSEFAHLADATAAELAACTETRGVPCCCRMNAGQESLVQLHQAVCSQTGLQVTDYKDRNQPSNSYTQSAASNAADALAGPFVNPKTPPASSVTQPSDSCRPSQCSSTQTWQPSFERQRRLNHLRSKFATTIQPQLYTDQDCTHICERLQHIVQVMGGLLQEGAAALSHQEMQLINVACDDPGASVGLQLVLPILQQRLDMEAAKQHEANARVVSDQLIAAEEAEREQRLRKQRKKAAQQHRHQHQCHTQLKLATQEDDCHTEVVKSSVKQQTQQDQDVSVCCMQPNCQTGLLPDAQAGGTVVGGHPLMVCKPQLQDNFCCSSDGSEQGKVMLTVPTAACNMQSVLAMKGIALADASQQSNSNSSLPETSYIQSSKPPSAAWQSAATSSQKQSQQACLTETTAATTLSASQHCLSTTDTKTSANILNPEDFPTLQDALQLHKAKSGPHSLFVRCANSPSPLPPPTVDAASRQSHRLNSGLESSTVSIKPTTDARVDSLASGQLGSPMSFAVPSHPHTDSQLYSIQETSSSRQTTPEPLLSPASSASPPANFLEPHPSTGTLTAAPPHSRPIPLVPDAQSCTNSAAPSVPHCPCTPLADSLAPSLPNQPWLINGTPDQPQASSPQGSFSFFSLFKPHPPNSLQLHAATGLPGNFGSAPQVSIPLPPEASAQHLVSSQQNKGSYTDDVRVSYLPSTSSSAAPQNHPANLTLPFPGGRPLHLQHAHTIPMSQFPSAVSSMMKELGIEDAPLPPPATYRIQPPSHFLCPLTHDVMRDPVVAADGFLYDRQAIEAWMLSDMNSPVTGHLLVDRRLMPVIPLRMAALQWCEQHGCLL